MRKKALLIVSYSKYISMKTILILDEVGQASIYNPVSYSDFMEANDNCQILLITNAASEKDKQLLKRVVEIAHPTSNGLLELAAFDLHSSPEFGPIDQIYTKQEDLILRASYLRSALKINEGLQPDEAILFRDKESMKSHLAKSGIRVPPFQRVYSPATILTFLNENGGFPIIVKPTLGSASAGVNMLNNSEELKRYFERDFYENINDKGKFDYSGELIVEKFVDGVMYHINGFAKDGKIKQYWPFQYISTNLGFTKGKAYGNLSISKEHDSALYEALYKETSRILASLPCPPYMVFHLEVFITRNNDIVLCEIAARRPGGSIALLIDSFVGAKGLFPRLEFRWSNGLDISSHVNLDSIQENSSLRVGDVMIPLRVGQLLSIPTAKDLSSVDGGLNIEIVPISKPGTVYAGFDINKINTCVRIKCSTSSVSSINEILPLLNKLTEEVQNCIQYAPLGDVAL